MHPNRMIQIFFFTITCKKYRGTDVWFISHFIATRQNIKNKNGTIINILNMGITGIICTAQNSSAIDGFYGVPVK